MIDSLPAFLDVNTVFFTVLGYPMSYIEFFGTIFNLLAVILIAKDRIINWPIGILGVVLFGLLFWQIRLYADFVEQIYFLITGFWGWWMWLQLRDKATQKNASTDITTLKTHQLAATGVLVLLGTGALALITTNLPVFLPSLFPEAPSFPVWDAATTAMTFAATVLLVHKKIESWILWIVVDIIGIWLYAAKGVMFVSLLYVIFLGNAIYGLYNWYSIVRKERPIWEDAEA